VKYYPVNLDLAGRKVLVIGAGTVAHRKTKSLVECGAKVTVVSPKFCPALARMGGIRRVRRGYRKTDLRGACLVISATDSEAVNRRVWEHGREAGIPVNVVDQPDLCTFTVPAVCRRGDIVIAISTGGGSPALSGRIRERIEATIGPAFGRHLDLLRQMRTEVRASNLDLEQRGALLRDMTGDEVREMIERQGIATARRHLRRLLAAAVAAPPPETPRGRPTTTVG
jgi:precorrin-2 dehydrogenase/sirohydrochlorin ferrochelatase